jgi:hypothetical protein
MAANSFAAFKGSENKKLLSDSAIAARYGGVGNQVCTLAVCCICVVFFEWCCSFVVDC